MNCEDLKLTPKTPHLMTKSSSYANTLPGPLLLDTQATSHARCWSTNSPGDGTETYTNPEDFRVVLTESELQHDHFCDPDTSLADQRLMIPLLKILSSVDRDANKISWTHFFCSEV